MERHNDAMQSRIDELMRACLTGDIELNAEKFRELAEYGITERDIMDFGQWMEVGEASGTVAQRSGTGMNNLQI